MRIFAGLPLPPHAVERLSALRLRLAAPGDGLRWTPPEQWHLTLHFFGDLDTRSLEAVQARMAEIRHRPPDMRMEGLGQFASKGLLYAAVQASGSLLTLQEAVLHCAFAAEVPPSSKPFHPHITLARSKNRIGLRSLARLGTPELPLLGPATWSSTAIDLYQSVLGPEGADYQLLASVPLYEAQTPGQLEN